MIVHDKPATSALARVAKAYSAPPWWYDLRGFFILTFSYRGTVGSQVSFFERNLSDNHLEMAVGTGTLFGFVIRRHRRRGGNPTRIVAVDYSETMLAGARRRFAGDEHITLAQADGCRLDFADESFTSVNIANALHCFPDPGAVLREIYRVLAPGGSLAVNALLHPRSGLWPARWLAGRINRYGIRKGLLVSPFHVDDVRRLFVANGFGIAEETISRNSWYVVARKPGGEWSASPRRPVGA